MAYTSDNGIVNKIADVYRGQPDKLKNKVKEESNKLGMGKIPAATMEALAYQKLLSEKEAAQNELQMAMDTDPNTIAKQLEQKTLGLTQNELAQTTGGALQQKEAKKKQAQQLAQKDAMRKVNQPQGLGLLSQQQKRPMPRPQGITQQPLDQLGMPQGMPQGMPTQLAGIDPRMMQGLPQMPRRPMPVRKAQGGIIGFKKGGLSDAEFLKAIQSMVGQRSGWGSDSGQLRRNKAIQDLQGGATVAQLRALYGDKVESYAKYTDKQTTKQEQKADEKQSRKDREVEYASLSPTERRVARAQGDLGVLNNLFGTVPEGFDRASATAGAVDPTLAPDAQSAPMDKKNQAVFDKFMNDPKREDYVTPLSQAEKDRQALAEFDPSLPKIPTGINTLRDDRTKAVEMAQTDTGAIREATDEYTNRDAAAKRLQELQDNVATTRSSQSDTYGERLGQMNDFILGQQDKYGQREQEQRDFMGEQQAGYDRFEGYRKDLIDEQAAMTAKQQDPRRLQRDLMGAGLGAKMVSNDPSKRAGQVLRDTRLAQEDRAIAAQQQRDKLFGDRENVGVKGLDAGRTNRAAIDAGIEGGLAGMRLNEGQYQGISEQALAADRGLLGAQVQFGVDQGTADRALAEMGITQGNVEKKAAQADADMFARISESATNADLRVAEANAKQYQSEVGNKLKQLVSSADLSTTTDIEKNKRANEIQGLKQKVLQDMMAKYDFNDSGEMTRFFLEAKAYFDIIGVFDAEEALGRSRPEDILKSQDVENLLNNAPSP